INGSKLQPGYSMINNSIATLDGVVPENDKIQFYWDRNDDRSAKSIFIPNTPQTSSGEYFWLGDGFVNQEMNNTTYIFGYRIRNTDAEVFPFEEVGNTL